MNDSAMAGPAPGRPKEVECVNKYSSNGALRTEETSNFSPAIAVPITVKMPEPMTAPIPSEVRLIQPSDFFNRFPRFRSQTEAGRCFYSETVVMPPKLSARIQATRHDGEAPLHRASGRIRDVGMMTAQVIASLPSMQLRRLSLWPLEGKKLSGILWGRFCAS